MTMNLLQYEDGMEVMVDSKVPSIIDRVTALIEAEGGSVRSVSPRAGRVEAVLSPTTADHVRSLQGVRLVRPIHHENYFAI